MNNFYLAADSGGSKTIWSLLNAEGKRITRIQTDGLGAIKPGILPVEETVKKAEDGIKKFGIPKGIYLSLGGPNVEEVSDALKKVWKNIPVKVEREACGNAMLKAAKFLDCSAVVMCGTGSTAVGDTSCGRVFCGGWGPIYGDEGSGGGMGSDALKLFLRHIDTGTDIGGLSGLFLKLTEGLDIKSFSGRMELKSRALNMSRKELASLAPNIYDLAINGDATAEYLYDKAAKEIALMANAVSDNTEKFKVLLCGGLFTNKPEFIKKCINHFKTLSDSGLYYTENFSPIIAAEIAVLSENSIDVNEKMFNEILKGDLIK